jgi:hypothetical protein
VPLKRRRDSPPPSTAEDLDAAVGSLSLAARKQESLGANKPPLFEASSLVSSSCTDGAGAGRDGEPTTAALPPPKPSSGAGSFHPKRAKQGPDGGSVASHGAPPLTTETPPTRRGRDDLSAPRP